MTSSVIFVQLNGGKALTLLLMLKWLLLLFLMELVTGVSVDRAELMCPQWHFICSKCVLVEIRLWISLLPFQHHEDAIAAPPPPLPQLDCTSSHYKERM